MSFHCFYNGGFGLGSFLSLGDKDMHSPPSNLGGTIHIP